MDADWVFHLAALADIVPSIENPTEYYKSNVNGTFNVLQACRKYQVKKIIYAGSSSCYGIPDEYPTKENAAIGPQYPYALTKNIGEQLVMHWCQLYNLPAISLRFFNVYGPRARTSGTYGAVFGVFLAQKLAKKPYTVVGDGNQTRDFTFVSDVVSALVTAAKSDLSGEVINIGSNNTYSINRLVELLGGDITYIPKRPGEPDCTVYTPAAAQSLPEPPLFLSVTVTVSPALHCSELAVNWLFAMKVTSRAAIADTTCDAAPS
jgi:UDP-glucose 4-epimerase